MIKELKELKEVDEIIPLIQELMDQVPYQYSLTGFLGWLAFNFYLPTCNVWVGYDEKDNAIGYAVALIESRYFERECIIIHAYTKKYMPEMTKLTFEEIKKWATKQGVKTISAYTEKAQALQKKYNFDIISNYLIKKI